MPRSPAATQRHDPAEEKADRSQNSDVSLQSERSIRSGTELDDQSLLAVPKKSYQVHTIGSNQNRKRLTARTVIDIIHMFT